MDLKVKTRGTVALLVCLCIRAFVAAPAMAASEVTLTGTFRVADMGNEPSVVQDAQADASVAAGGSSAKNHAPKVAQIAPVDDTVGCLPGQQAHVTLQVRVTDANGAADITLYSPP